MRYRSLTLLATAVLVTGGAPPIANADAPPAAQIEPADPGQDAHFQAAMETEEKFRSRRARLMRLRMLAEERADAERVMEIEEVLHRLEDRHRRRMDRHRSRLEGEWRSRFDEVLHEAREQRNVAREQRRDLRSDAHDQHRDDRRDARGRRRDDRHESSELRQDGRQQRRAQRRGVRGPAHDDRQPIRVEVRDDRRAAPANVRDQRPAPGAEPRSLAGADDRRPVGRTRSVAAENGGRAKLIVGGRRPVPEPRPAPGVSVNLHRGVGNGPASSRNSVKLTSPNDARHRAASTISHDNADKELARLLEEIERED